MCIFISHTLLGLKDPKEKRSDKKKMFEKRQRGKKARQVRHTVRSNLSVLPAFLTIKGVSTESTSTMRKTFTDIHSNMDFLVKYHTHTLYMPCTNKK